MRVDRIAPAIGGGDLGYGAIGGANAAVARFDLHDGIFRYRADGLALADLGVMAATVDRLDDDIVAVGIFVRQPAPDDTADPGAGIGGRRSHDDSIGQGGGGPRRP